MDHQHSPQNYHHHNHHHKQHSSSSILNTIVSRMATRKSHNLPLAALNSAIAFTTAKRAATNNSNNNNRTKYYINNNLVSLSPNSLAAALLVLIIILLASSSSVDSLNCYSCSSADNPSCDEPFTGRANFTDTDCERAIGRPAKVCRKLVQYIEHKKVVIRSCGYIDDHEEKDRKPMCYKRSGTFALMMESCVCYEDNCNHSASLVPNRNVLLLLALAASTGSLLFTRNYLDYCH